MGQQKHQKSDTEDRPIVQTPKPNFRKLPGIFQA